MLTTAPIRKENEIIILIPFMKDLSNPLEYGAPFQAILRDYFSKFKIENYKIKPYFIIGNVPKYVFLIYRNLKERFVLVLVLS